MISAFLNKQGNIVIQKNNDGDLLFLCSKERSMDRIHWSMLKPFKLTNGSYMMSNELLILIAKIFKKDYEDLYNDIYFRDQIYLDRSKTFVVRPKRTDEGCLNDCLGDLGILGDHLI